MSISNTADQLGHIQAKIADLRSIERELKDAILASGEEVVEGDLFRASVSFSERTTVAWKKVAEFLGADRQSPIVVANTKRTLVETVRITARTPIRGDE